MRDEGQREAAKDGGRPPGDPPHEPIFDHLAGLAARACHTPMAAIVLLDSERWCLRAAVGLDLREAPRGDRIVDRVFRDARTQVVADLAADPQLRDDPLFAGAAEPRFCAAAPLTLADGERVGVLVVLDIEPRDGLDPQARALLDGLAATVADAVHLARYRLLAGKAMEERIAGSEALYQLIAENSSDAIATFDPKGVFTYLSPAVAEVLGYSPAELIGRTPMEFIHPKDLPAVMDLFRAQAAAGPGAPTVRFEYRAKRKDGTRIWLEAHPRAIFDAAGKLTGFQDTVRDITARKTAEIALAASEQRYARIAHYATDVILRVDLTGHVIYASPSAEKVLGFSEADLAASAPRYLDRVHREDLRRVYSCMAEVMSDTPPEDSRVAYRFQRKDGEWVWLESNPTILRDDRGSPVEFLDLVRDVSAQQQLEASLRAARDAAEAAAQVKTDFIANMSHEIRTPLTSIIGFTKMLGARTDLDPQAQRYVQRLGAAGDALLAVVNDVLDFSKLEAGKFEIRPRPTDPEALLREAEQMFLTQAAERGLTLTAEFADLPAAVMIDPDRVRQIVLNLLGNAVKFTQAGGVRLTARYEAAAARLEVAIVDTGPGMDAEAQGKLFQSFTQVDGSATRRHGGTGLGLAISKGLAEAMGGTISVRSVLGEGSTFRLVVPAPLAAAAGP